MSRRKSRGIGVGWRKEVWGEGILIGALGASLLLGWVTPGEWNRWVWVGLSVVGAIPVGVSAAKSLLGGEVGVDLLASIALGFAFLAREWHSAVFVALMLAFARLFDKWTQGRTKQVMEQLLKYLPEMVKVKRGEEMVEVRLEEVRVGDIVAVEAGERVPVDGVVVEGEANVNEATLTGESELVVKKKGDAVFGSTLNESGGLLIAAEKVGKDSRLEKMAVLVDEASRKKAKSEKMAGKFAKWYVLAMLVLAGGGYLVWRNTETVLAMLLVVCADDLAVGIPLTFSVAIARGGRMGLLVKGSEVMEKMGRVKVMVTDKTGTLTAGKPRVVRVERVGRVREETVMKMLGVTAGASKHPVSRAIEKYVKEKVGEIGAAEEFEEKSGQGVEVRMGRGVWWLGKVEAAVERRVELGEENKRKMDEEREGGNGVTVLVGQGKLVAWVVWEDGIKAEAAEVIGVTKKLGVEKWVMLTGDNERVARKVAQKVGVDEWEADMAPEEKIARIEELKRGNQVTVGMIGDGANDAAALAAADVSMAMGALGSDAAIEAADVAIVRDNLRKIPEVMKLGRKTMEVMRQEYVIWGITNAVGFGLVLAGVIGPAGAAAYNFATDFLPIVNALRLLKVKLS